MDDVEIEYVGVDLDGIDPALFDQFKGVFDKFVRPEELMGDKTEKEEDDPSREVKKESSETAESGTKTLSKKKRKLLSRLTVAQLKQLVSRPDVVEAHDTTSHDPKLLVFLKSYHNTVPVPRHWCHKRKYLAGKRGIDRPPFLLPEFIAETGIAKIRESVLEQEAAKKSSQKARDKMTPKMGKIDIDYQVLHDAFFKYQTKPEMTKHGDIYYEGKEFELNLKEHKPGSYSKELLVALGMRKEDSNPNDPCVVPPPWLINMQRYGPPPSYPNLRIPGLNAPIPAGCQYGYQPGGWGKPPVDEYGNAIYGDVFGVENEANHQEVVVDKSTKWGELLVSEEMEEDYEDEDEDLEEDASGMETPSVMDGFNSVNTIATGLETPDGSIDLRKRMGTDGMDTPIDYQPRELYHIVKEQTQQIGGTNALFASDKTYVMPGSDIQVSVDPTALGDKKQIEALYEEEMSQHVGEGEEMTNANVESDPRNKRKRRAEATVNSKRHRDFKF